MKHKKKIHTIVQLFLFICLCLGLTAQASTDYGPAVWRPVYSGHWYTTGYGHKFHVCHDIEGYYLSAISYFQRSTTKASVHYWTNGKKDYASDAAAGEVSQSVRDAYYAWHALCWNRYSTGNEHEGFVSNPAWFTEALYSASAGVTRHLAAKFGMTKDRNHIIGHDQKRISGWPSFASSHFGIDPYCNTHTDPGRYWNWTHYMDLVKGTTSTPSGPSNLAAATVSTSQIKLTWVDHSGIETGFKIERGTASTGPFSQIATVGANVLSYTAGSLSSGTRYYFRVRAYNATGNSPYSNVANATTKDTMPAAPSALTATAVSNDQINLAWTDNSANEDGFRVYRSTDGTNFTQLATTGINVKTYSNTGLTGNRKYWYKVCSYNTAGNSAFTAVASDTTAPQAPSALVATNGATWSEVSLSWTDNASSEVGFKIERSTDNVTFTQIATNAASVRTFTDTGRAGTTKYYYRVRSYNANGNSDYSNVASFTTPNAPPVLGAIGNKTVAAGSPLAFTATATDPNKVVTTPWTGTWEGNAHGDMEVMFNKPANSGTTTAFIDTAATNYSMVVTGAPSGVGGTKALKAGWTFKTGQTDYWVRYNTYTAPSWPNPTIALDQVVKFRLYTTKKLKVGVGIRETGTSAAYGANGGTTGDLEWAAVTNVLTGSKPVPNRSVNTNTWTTLTFNLPFEPQAAFTGDGKIVQTGAKGVLDHIILKGDGGTGAYVTYLDDISVVLQNTLNFTLETGAPAGAAIERKTGKFTWTPTTGQVGVFSIGVRVTDQLGAIDNEIIKVTVTGTGNAAPVLNAIGSKTVNESSALGFTASATDANPGQTLTYSLDAGAPAGASINSASGAFAWTPTEAQGPGSYPITIRVTDNGSPVSNDWETITVTVNEVNAAPVLAAIADQTVTEGNTLSLTASATDADTPANTLTYSLLNAPAGMTINASSGAMSWTTTDSDGPDVVQVTVKVTDNGSPSLYAARSFNVTVNDLNTAPVLTLATGSTNVITFANFEDSDPGAYNGNVLFRVPKYSSTTSAFMESTPNETVIETNYPDLDVNTSSQVMYAGFGFKTGMTNPFLRLTTYSLTPTNGVGAFDLPNPTIELGARVRFDIWSDKSVKVAIGVRETGTGAPVGEDGGYTGTIEWVGSTATLTGGCPTPTRTVSASNWTTLEFDLPAEACSAFTGNGVLTTTGKGTLECLGIVPNGGMGTYNVYLDNFQVVKVSTSLTVDTGATITLDHSASDSDSPAQNLTFSLDAGAPAGAVIDPETGVFTWTPTPAQSPSTNVITVRVTDDGTPAMSDAKSQTIIVNKVNTPPRLEGLPEHAIETTSGVNISFTATALDDDVPADTLTFSLVGTVPPGATINATTGDFSWTPPAGNSTNTITVRVTDNGVPPLYDEQNVTILVVPANAAPVLTLGKALVSELFASFETYTNNTPNEYVMFKKPGNSSTTTNYIDLAATNYSSVTTSFPTGHSSAKVLKVGWSFKTGTSNYWVRLTTYNTASLPNPTIALNGRVKFDIYTTKSLKVGLGVRETGTSAAFGANGGTTGAIEYVGCSSQIGSTPIPTRTVNASNWTTLEFNLPTEPMQTMTGNSVLDGLKGTLEHLILLGNGGTGAYTVYLDNFTVVTETTLPGTVNMNVGSTVTVAPTAVDPDPGAGLEYGLDADADTNATINVSTGAFSFTPTAAGTSTFIVVVEDNPTNGAIMKSDEDTFTITAVADPFGVLSTDGLGYVAAGETVTMSWDAVVGASYMVQKRASVEDEWSDVGTVVADSKTASTAVSGEAYYRIVDLSGTVQDE